MKFNFEQDELDRNQRAHEEEEKLLRQAKALRLEAQKRREDRLGKRNAVEREKRQKLETEKRDLEYRKRQEEKRKAARDEQIRGLLLPLTTRLQSTGWRIELPPYKPDAPVFTLTRSNQYPPEEVKIYWQEGSLFGNNRGFHWE